MSPEIAASPAAGYPQVMDAGALREFFDRFGSQHVYDGGEGGRDRAGLLAALTSLGVRGVSDNDGDGAPHVAIIAIDGLELDVFIVALADLAAGVRDSLGPAAGIAVQSLHELDDADRVGAAARLMAATGVLPYEEYEDAWEELADEYDEDSLPDPEEFAELSEVLTPTLAATTREGVTADRQRFARTITRSLGIWRRV